jgi:hypothetical protein
MNRIMKAGFKSSAAPMFNIYNVPDPEGQGGAETVNRKIIATECLVSNDVRDYRAIKDWSIEIGVEVQSTAAVKRARKFIKKHRDVLIGGQPLLIPRWTQTLIYQVAVTGLSRDNAINTCLSVRSESIYCVVRSSRLENIAMDRALRVLKAVAKRDQKILE